jgi:hypothetical protein
MGVWHDVGQGHRIQAIPVDDRPGACTILWEHDTPAGYHVVRHQVSSASGATWTAAETPLIDDLTLSPSLHCDPAKGGCGMHGFVRAGRWC